MWYSIHSVSIYPPYSSLQSKVYIEVIVTWYQSAHCQTHIMQSDIYKWIHSAYICARGCMHSNEPQIQMFECPQSISEFHKKQNNTSIIMSRLNKASCQPYIILYCYVRYYTRSKTYDNLFSLRKVKNLCPDDVGCHCTRQKQLNIGWDLMLYYLSPSGEKLGVLWC